MTFPNLPLPSVHLISTQLHLISSRTWQTINLCWLSNKEYGLGSKLVRRNIQWWVVKPLSPYLFSFHPHPRVTPQSTIRAHHLSSFEFSQQPLSHRFARGFMAGQYLEIAFRSPHTSCSRAEMNTLFTQVSSCLSEECWFRFFKVSSSQCSPEVGNLTRNWPAPLSSTADPWFLTNAPGLLKILQGAVFPVGLVMIVLFNVDLVTASQAVFILSTLKRKVPIWAFVIDWTIVFVANLCGALLFCGIVTGSKIFELPTDAIAISAASVGRAKLGPNFGEILLRGEWPREKWHSSL